MRFLEGKSLKGCNLSSGSQGFYAFLLAKPQPLNICSKFLSGIFYLNLQCGVVVSTPGKQMFPCLCVGETDILIQANMYSQERELCVRIYSLLSLCLNPVNLDWQLLFCLQCKLFLLCKPYLKIISYNMSFMPGFLIAVHFSFSLETVVGIFKTMKCSLAQRKYSLTHLDALIM